MAGVLYESSQDRMVQLRAVMKLCKYSGLVWRATDRLAVWDFELFRGKDLVYLCEVKSRSHRFGRFSALNISASKIDQLISSAQNKNCKAILLIDWLETFGCTVLREDCPYPFVDNWGRSDRPSDRKQKEKAYAIPITEFSLVENIVI